MPAQWRASSPAPIWTLPGCTCCETGREIPPLSGASPDSHALELDAPAARNCGPSLFALQANLLRLQGPSGLKVWKSRSVSGTGGSRQSAGDPVWPPWRWAPYHYARLLSPFCKGPQRRPRPRTISGDQKCWPLPTSPHPLSAIWPPAATKSAPYRDRLERRGFFPPLPVVDSMQIALESAPLLVGRLDEATLLTRRHRLPPSPAATSSAITTRLYLSVARATGDEARLLGDFSASRRPLAEARQQRWPCESMRQRR